MLSSLPAHGESMPYPGVVTGRLPLVLVAATLVGAFGFWFTPAVIVVFALLGTPDYSLTEGFLLLSVMGLSAACFRFVLDRGPALRRDAELLLVVLLSLLVVNVATLWLLQAGPANTTQLYWLSVLSGLGGGSFAVLNRVRCAPRDHMPTLSLEAVSVAGHLGIVLALLVLPLLITLPLWSQHSTRLLAGSSHFLGRIEAGASVWLVWPAFVWLLWSNALLVLWILVPSWRRALCWRHSLALGGRLLAGTTLIVMLAAVLWLQRLDALAWYWLLLFAGVAITGNRSRGLVAGPGSSPWLWSVTLGCFLGLSATFPLLTLSVFYPSRESLAVPYPAIFLYAWMLPLGAILLRPVGPWAVRRWGVKQVLALCLLTMCLASLSLAWWMYRALQVAYAQPFFPGYILSFALLFGAAGVGNAALIFRARAQPGRVALAALAMAAIPLLLASLPDHLPLVGVILAVYFALCSLAWTGGRLPLKRPKATPL